MAKCPLHRAVKAQQFFDSGGDQRGIVTEFSPLIWVAQERKQAGANRAIILTLHILRTAGAFHQVIGEGWFSVPQNQCARLK